MGNLFGDDFNIVLKQNNAKKVAKKIKDVEEEEVDVDKLLKSSKLTIEERLSIIRDKVLRVLGKQKNNVLVIKDRKTFDEYISKALTAGRIAVDTETNNSLDPVTCKLMGLCLYIPGEKQAYIPINHRDYKTHERLAWQLTEADCAYELNRIIDAKNAGKLKIIMHNGKFDYEVLKCTCGVCVVPDWDTIIAARLLDENEEAGLKYQYTTKIDRSQAKYDIEKLFTNVQYADVDPEIFALYAATDSFMTDKLYEWQLPIMTSEEYKKLYWVFTNIEMPIVIVTAEMELRGVCVDTAFGARLKQKYNLKLEKVDAKIENSMKLINPLIEKWKLTPEANEKTKQYQPKKSKLSLSKLEERYPEIEQETGLRYRVGKPKAQQLTEPINLASPVQLAILFYDVLKCPEVSKKAPRGTGEEELKKLSELLQNYKKEIKALKDVSDLVELELAEDEDGNEIEALEKDTTLEAVYSAAVEFCDLLLDRRGIVKLITTYIDVIPELVKHWPDRRIRFHLNSLGTDTGRYSSGGKLKFMEGEEAIEIGGINIQNIPSHEKAIRMLFKAREDFNRVEITDNFYELDNISEVETADGWKFGKDLVIGDRLTTEAGEDTIKNIVSNGNKYLIYV